MRSLIVLMIVLASSTVLLAAPPSEWRSTGIGGGGALFSPCFDPHDPKSLWVSCDMSALYHSADLGQSWRTVPYRSLQVGRLSPKVGFTSDPNILYMIDSAQEKKTPVKSTDGGKTWSPLPGDPTEAEAWNISVDPTRTDRLLLSDYSTLYLSTDGGNSFARKYAVKRGDPLVLAGAFFDEQFMAVGTSAGLLVSTDGGQTLEPARVNGLPAGESMVSFAAGKSNNRLRLACITQPASNVYVGMQGDDHPNFRGLYTLDWGKSGWVKKGGLPGGVTPFFVVMANNNADVICAGGGSSAGVPSICRSINGGDAWQSVFLTENNRNIATGWSGYRGDRDWTYSEFLFGLAVHPADANRLACSDYGFVHVSTDGGKSWRQAYVHPADQNPAGRPTPKGKVYRGNGIENTSCWQVTWFSPKTLWACFADIRGIRSTDGGSAWSFDYKGQELNSSYHVVVHPTTKTAYMATSSVHDLYESSHLQDAKIDKGTGDVLFSTNQGKTWQPLGKLGLPVVGLALDPTNPRRLYASAVNSQKGGIFVCQDITQGARAQWQRLPAPPRTEGHPFNVHVLADGTLVCTFSGRRTQNFTPSSGVFVSSNGGASWEDRSHPNMQWWTRDLVVDPHDPEQNTWYVGVFSGWGGQANGKGGLYRTTDRGKSWNRIWEEDRVASVTVHPTKKNELYVTTETNGLWHTTNADAARPEFQVVESFPFRQPERVIFNPHQPGEVWVTTFGNGLWVGRES